MAAEAATLVSAEMISARDVWTGERVAPAIALSDIRRWVIATYWPDTPPRLHWDEDYARTTRWCGVIAPADFNPFVWPAVRPRAVAQPTPSDGQALTGMNGGQTDTYGVPMRPGDVISARSRLSDWHERQGRFGLMLYTFTEQVWTNQNGEFVRRRIATSIRYRSPTT